MVFGVASKRRRKTVPNILLKAGLHGFDRYTYLHTYLLTYLFTYWAYIRPSTFELRRLIFEIRHAVASGISPRTVWNC